MQRLALKIRTYPDPCLSKKSTPVKEVGAVERMLIGSMIEAMHGEEGVGLAAPQVGINQRILVVDIGEGAVVIINPKIMKESGSVCLEEGCLSVPGMTVEITRSQKILVKYLNETGKCVEKVFEDLMARVILHEMDHLNGKTIVDYASFEEKAKIQEAVKIK